MQLDLSEAHRAFLSTDQAGRREMRYALAAMLVSAVFFLATLPFADRQLAQVPAFIPVYVATLVICDLITAALLFGQFSVLRLRALLLLASGYLFTAVSTLAYALIFPGLFMPTSLTGAGPQTSSAMYMFWHSGFPLVVIAYTRFMHSGSSETITGDQVHWRPRHAIVATVVGVLVIVGAFTSFATLGQAYIPVFLEGNHTTPLGHTVLLGIWLMNLLALGLLLRRQQRTVLDVWLLVVMGVWLFDIALSALLNTGRYDLGWYVGRIYGVLGASFLLIVLLIENGRQYAQLLQVSIELSAANKALAHLSRSDGLTGLANRRYFDEYLAEQIALAYRQQRPLALVLCDVDHFKAYNDHYGHQAGDACLKQVAAVLDSCCKRPADLAARYGGEEFVMVLPDTDLAGATRVAEAARHELIRRQIPHAQSRTGSQVTISAGVAVLGLQPSMTSMQVIACADQALYRAKSDGRNRVVSTEGVAAV